MALNFTVSYTFTPGTTISSSQVNTNESDIAGVFTGLEALTKSFSNLRVDATPTSTTDVAIKSYVDKLDNYRRPVLQFSSVSVINLETGINGTSGQAQILFSDGTLRTDSTATRINFDITRNAALSGSAQSGLRSSLSEAANTWYALYAVKVTDNSSNFVVVGDTNLPLQANFSTLNSNFGSNGWVYLGLVRNGDNSGATTDLLTFVQSGNMTIFKNAAVAVSSGGGPNGQGIVLGNATSNTILTWTYASGTGTTQVPSNISIGKILGNVNPGSSAGLSMVCAGYEFYVASGSAVLMNVLANILNGITLNGPASSNYNIYFAGFVDGVLGVGANPIL